MKKIAAYIAAGNTRRCAATACGINVNTLYTWLKQDAAFREMIESADAEAEAHNIKIILDAAESSPKNWTAAAWWLERKYPKDWGKRERHEITGKDGRALSIAFTFTKDGDKPAEPAN